MTARGGSTDPRSGPGPGGRGAPGDSDDSREHTRGEGGDRASLSLVVITRDEEEALPGCLESVPFADEIVVVDDRSGDATRDVARRYTDEVHVRELDRFGYQKQYAIEQATGDWILCLDADERPNDQLREAIRAILREDDPDVHGYFVRRLTRLGGRPVRHSGWYKCSHLRLFRRGRARYLNRRVHEYAVLDEPDRSECLPGHLEHGDYPQGDALADKQRRYARLAAEDWYDMGRRVSWLSAPFWFVLRPLSVVLRKLFGQLGLLDGVAGLRIAWMAMRADLRASRHLWTLTRERREESPGFY